MDPTNLRPWKHYFTPMFCFYNLMCVFVWGIMGWAFYAYNYVLCIHLLADQPIRASIFIVIFTVLWFLLTVSNLRTTFRDPGSVPLGFAPEGVDPEAPPPTNIGSSRYCSKCKNYKPDRTHHCPTPLRFPRLHPHLLSPASRFSGSLCKKCVLKMDHHCPWVNNCVGWRNYKFFMLFLFYSVATCLWTAISLLPTVIEFDLKELDSTKIQLLVLIFVSGSFGVALLCFAGNHIYLVFNNATTIESFELRRKGNPYHMGRMTNWRQVFGPSPLLWFMPVANSIGTGLSFPKTDLPAIDALRSPALPGRRLPSIPSGHGAGISDILIDSSMNNPPTPEDTRLLPGNPRYD